MKHGGTIIPTECSLKSKPKFGREKRSSRSTSRSQQQCTLPQEPMSIGGGRRVAKRSFPANGSISGLSQDEKRMIELCWFKCTQKQLKKCTEDIFADILKQDESLLKLFNLESVPPHRVRDNEFFKSHAANFAIVLNLVVTNFNDNFERTCDALQTLGYEHVNLRPRGFQMMYWDIFTDCFEQNRPMSFRKDAEKDAWSRMILFILRQMKIGYSRGVADKKIERLSMPIIY
ncbi:unnamed protein product [Nippostrongylus brasiliensis]|uniref:GLOBIN domain-containing protein n=1 Tax=Nippostrongylus brasiliensis TaxID=27835 RepID=A0A0N4YDS2_NIPBR|nr:unnamed protein product [Nippostrongylus brasiliensis]